MQRQSSFGKKQGRLYLVPTPIGNLEDITLRAKRVLQAADYIACEDTRTSGILLKKIGVHNKLLSFHKFNSKQKAPELIKMLQAGATIAEISDAGMPVISDPGYILVQECIKHDLPVVALPGPSAFATALIASGFNQPFTYYGFLPKRKKDQQALFTTMKKTPTTAIFYEAPHRLAKTVAGLAQVLEPDRKMVLARELTKVHEEYVRGTVAEINAYLKEHAPRGEYVVLVAPAQPQAEQPADLAALAKQVAALVAAGSFAKDAIKQVAQENKVPKNQLYDYYQRRK
ncbi:MAG: 16S rRNA (cytidine(1402)-2'-O)-methyltransferase [Lactobacillus sp.]